MSFISYFFRHRLCRPALVAGRRAASSGFVFSSQPRNKRGVTGRLYTYLKDFLKGANLQILSFPRRRESRTAYSVQAFRLDSRLRGNDNNSNVFKQSLITIILLLLPFSAHAENKNNVEATLISESSAIKPGEKIRFGVMLKAAEGWHTYYKTPGDAGLPTKLTWQLPQGFSASEIDWPEPTKFSEGPLTTYGYTGTVLLPVTITVPQNLSDSSYDFNVKAEWLTCNQICVPESQSLSINLPVGEIAPSEHKALFKEHKPSGQDASNVALLAILVSALAGGLVLNIMPCVLPILSLKTLALVKKSGQVRAHTIRYGIAYTLGVLASFAALAALLIALQKSGEAIGWGFQMQSPAFVGFLIYLLFLIGLNLSGMFTLPVLLGGVGGELANKNSVSGSFFTGVLATMVATPCTAPFMASAVGVALALPPLSAMLVFLTLGFGLALPFLLISIFPGLLYFLPKPGAWMEKFKEFLAFPIYATVIWLLWVLGLQTGMDAVVMVLGGMLLIAFMVWLQQAVAPCKISHRIFTLFATLLMLMATLYSLEKNTVAAAKNNSIASEQSLPYSAQLLGQLRAEGKAVYVDATAAWCVTCQLNKHAALDTKRTRQAFADNNVTLLIADWTRRNPEITEFLGGFGYNGVPLNVFYPAGGGEPVILPQILSEETVINTIAK
jgi:thiol:disulfide interchange protein DsbD